ncbi:hypothetical protein POVWA2_022290 [Plasmodium ovale wallikeri]|nr:hypothetical protein POVWA2_022290 [Plasmodium ovale wallikeri]
MHRRVPARKILFSSIFLQYSFTLSSTILLVIMLTFFIFFEEDYTRVGHVVMCRKEGNESVYVLIWGMSLGEDLLSPIPASEPLLFLMTKKLSPHTHTKKKK